MKTKDQISRELYGDRFSNLYPGQKATVTRAYNQQGHSAPAAHAANVVKASIGRVGVNGLRACLLSDGATISDLVSQAGFTLDAKKEGVLALSTGLPVRLTDAVINGEEYSITVEVKSA